MRKVKLASAIFLIIMIVVGSIFAPNIFFDYYDNRALNVSARIASENSVIFTKKKATLEEKLQSIRNTSTIASIDVDEQDKEEMKNIAEEYYHDFTIFFGIVCDIDYIEVKKLIYMNSDENFSGFAVYSILLEDEYYSFSIIIDEENRTMLQAKIKGKLSEEYLDLNNVNNYTSKLLKTYYPQFSVYQEESRNTDTWYSVATDMVEEYQYSYVLTYILRDSDNIIEYKIRVEKDAVIFNYE